MHDCIISIHTPAKGVTSVFLTATFSLLFQSTLPRREWRIVRLFQLGVERISIHTPAKGVTLLIGTYEQILQFQSTLPRREWPCINSKNLEQTQFQSTLPRREWQGTADCLWNMRNFNPHSREGSDHSSGYLSGETKFQSTLPRREWQQFYLILGFIFFNITQFYQYHSLFLISFL